MIDKFVRVVEHAFQKDKYLLFLEGTKGGYDFLIEDLVYEATVLSESGSTGQAFSGFIPKDKVSAYYLRWVEALFQPIL